MIEHDLTDGPLWDWEAEQGLRARDLTTWTLEVPTARQSSRVGLETQTNPRLVAGRLIGTLRNPGFVFAASPDDGRILWRHAVGPFSREILDADEEHVYVAAADHLRAIRVSDGRTRWKYRPPIESPRRLLSPPRVHGDAVLLFDREGALQAVDVRNGKARWRTAIAPPPVNSTDAPLVVDGLVVTRADDHLVACELETGEMVWETPVAYASWGRLQRFGPHLLIDGDDELSLLDPRDGSARAMWSSPPESVVACTAVGDRIAVVLRSPESPPIPGTPPMRYSPERLVLLDAALSERASLPYPPFAMVRLHHDAEAGLLLESTSSGLGFVEPKAGTRRAIVYAFPDGEDREAFLPVRLGHHLYRLTSSGTLFRMRHPIFDRPSE